MLALPVFAFVVAASRLQAQASTSPADSQAILRAARTEQEKLEQIRLQDLPFTAPGDFDRCDELVKGHCFVRGDSADWEQPEESQSVMEARDTMLAHLERAAATMPGDRWIAGQRVRYLVEARKPNAARTAATQCQPEESWWCLALAGYAAHAAGEYVPAEAAFDKAREAMSAAQRCKWDDISLLLPGSPARVYTGLECEMKQPIEQRFWWLADPLFLIPGNERRSEHFFRRVAIELEQQAPSVSRKLWTPGAADLAIRYGAPIGWEREESASLIFDPEPEIVSRYRRGSTQLLDPGWRALERPETLTPDGPPMQPDEAVSLYGPAYAREFDTLRYQVAIFRRGDSAVVLAAYDVSSDSVKPETATLGGLYHVASERGLPRSARKNGDARDVLLLAELPRAGLLSVEALTIDGRRAGRARYWLPLAALPAHEIALSDILLLSRTDSPPRTLAEAMPLARPNSTVKYQETLGLYWEVYGLGSGSVPLSLRLTVVKGGSSFLGRAARTLGLGGEPRPAVSLKWNEMSHSGNGPTTGTIALDLARNEPGRYTIRLEVTSQGRGTGARRQITIVRPK